MSREQDSTPAQKPQRYLPQILRQTPRWCRWSLVKDRRGKPTKRPDCSTKDPEARRELKDVEGPVDKKQGIGFITGGAVPTPRGYLIAIDYDNCVSPDHEHSVSPWAKGAIEAFHHSFTEISPSGYGLRQWVLVENLPTRRIRSVIPIDAEGIKGCDKRVEVQLFGHRKTGGGYVTVTGNHLPWTNKEVLRIRSLDAIFEHFNVVSDESDEDELHELPVGHGEPPEWHAIDVLVKNQPHGAELVKGDWHATDHPTASHAFFELSCRTILAAQGHGLAARDYLLNHTAWGYGDIEDSRDPHRYEREGWVGDDLIRACAKTGVATVAAGDSFTELSEDDEAEVEEIKEKAKKAQIERSPILQTAPPERPWFDADPPEREYLLHHPDGRGLLPRGKVGLLSAAGGTGKTTALVQLAVAVATRGRWFGHYVIGKNAGARVMMLLGEEDADEVRRKLFYTCRDLGLDRVQLAEVEARVVALPLAGHALPLLLHSKDGNLTGSVHGEALHERLQQGDDWGLVVIDPISRFTGVNIESDNVIATRYVQELERFAGVPGEPTVLAVGHTSKQARREGSADQRGVTGLFDAVRWAATLNTSPADGTVEFEVKKNNLGPPSEPVTLIRGPRGLLEAENDEHRSERERQEAEAARAQQDERQRRLDETIDSYAEDAVEHCRENPGATTNEIVAGKTGRKTDRMAGVRRAVSWGQLRVEEKGRARRHFVADDEDLLS